MTELLSRITYFNVIVLLLCIPNETDFCCVKYSLLFFVPYQCLGGLQDSDVDSVSRMVVLEFVALQ